ncbi:multiple epidermal growth factor-like domains protein 10 isoform X1 [Haliotis cracherodii]|uniref:multiple epidermal growth factor-like domains protein 10 isoform X1 n=1 Tax=Haliotis cracherodii TaxID=6455 RepID=UPI0039EBE906
MAACVGVVFLFACLSVVAGDCTPGKYGNRCSYQCHCPLVNCNPTSGCEPAYCSEGWSGPTCQKENIAFKKTTSSSSVHFPSSNAVNGDTGGGDEQTCFHSVYDDASITYAWWRVDLGNETLVRGVVIYFRTNYKVRRNGIQIYIADTAISPTDGVNCYNVTGNRDGTDIPDVLNVTCSGEGRFLVLYTTVNNEKDKVNVPVLDFCEVKVEVCGPGTFGAVCDNYCHCDGEVCNYMSGVCPSGVCLPGWKPDKCDTVCVFGSYGTNCNRRCSDRHCKGDNSSCARVTGTCVEGCKAGWNGTDCIQKCVNSYGEGCVHLCSSRRCSGTSSCNHVTGDCENGCIPGWKHIDCTEPCVQGVEYGAGCVGNCSARMCKGGNVTCPRDTGRCESGCQPGWKGEDCTTACVQDVEYGEVCVGNCSARMCKGGNVTCPRDTGQCESGCQSGWKGEDCTQACIQGLQYGAGCLDNCTTRMCEGGTGTCPRDTGRCESGCQSGWKGEDCTSACVQGDEYGAGCKGSCRARKCLGESGACPRDTGRCEDGCQSGWEGEDCAKVAGLVNENSVARTDPPFSHIIGVVIGLVVGVVLTLLLTGGVHLYLFRKGRLLWSRDLVKDGKGKETADSSMTLADNYTSISELPHTDGRNTQDKDYAGLDTGTRDDNKHYDVIQNKVYENA